MKIVSWNLKNVGTTKLNKQFTPKFRSYGLGNTIKDYIVNLVIGNKQWTNITGVSETPSDVFVMIELKSGGKRKGQAVSGTCKPTLTLMCNALNSAYQARFGVQDENPYVAAVPLVTGYHETVGVIYNTNTVKLNKYEVYRNATTGSWITPRTPGGAQLTEIATEGVLQVVGIHAPPPNGSNDLKFRNPVQYCNQLQTIAPARMANTFYMGDFNCNPASYYVNGSNVKVYPFTQLFALDFQTFVPNGTLSSVRQKIAGGLYPNQNSYLNDAYDNIIFNTEFEKEDVDEPIPDMIGNARDMSQSPAVNLWGSNRGTSAAVLAAYNAVSDHLPVIFEWTS